MQKNVLSTLADPVKPTPRLFDLFTDILNSLGQLTGGIIDPKVLMHFPSVIYYFQKIS